MPVYPLGHGLGHISFAYIPVTVTPAAGGPTAGLHVATGVRNTDGARRTSRCAASAA